MSVISEFSNRLSLFTAQIESDVVKYWDSSEQKSKSLILFALLQSRHKLNDIALVRKMVLESMESEYAFNRLLGISLCNYYHISNPGTTIPVEVFTNNDAGGRVVDVGLWLMKCEWIRVFTSTKKIANDINRHDSPELFFPFLFSLRRRCYQMVNCIDHAILKNIFRENPEGYKVSLMANIDAKQYEKDLMRSVTQSAKALNDFQVCFHQLDCQHAPEECC